MENNIKAARQHSLIISNCLLEPYFASAYKKAFIEIGIQCDLTFVDINEFYSLSRSLDFTSIDSIVVCLNIESLIPDFTFRYNYNEGEIEGIRKNIKTVCNQLYQNIRNRTKTSVIWFGFENSHREDHYIFGHVYSDINQLIFELNRCLYELLYEESDILVDMESIISSIGIRNAFSSKTKYRWNMPYSKILIEEMANECRKQYLIRIGCSPKCIVLDCDNVLWGGVLSEDGIEKIELGFSGYGKSFADFQRYLLTLYQHGVILSICSKNDLDDVLKVFREHTGMILKEEHIACFQVNWNNKVDNIRKIADFLNIGLDSMVFIDDMDFEIQAVKTVLPNVTSIKFNRDTIYQLLSCFSLKSNVDIHKIQQRTKTYRTNAQRFKLKESCVSFSEYLSLLEMHVVIHPANSSEVARISELTQRANKCTNGRRYTIAEIQSKLANGTSYLYTVSVSDRFSDLGIVGVIIIENNMLESFCLSCRALGRGMEKQMIQYIMDKHQINRMELLSTGKNQELIDLLKRQFPHAIVVY